MATKKQYIAIDLKSFYASVECVERGLNPLTANLVVADESRTDKTICLAVSPSLKAYGISGRARLYEVKSKVKDINNTRRRNAPKGIFTCDSCESDFLRTHPEASISFICAKPRMHYYMKYSAKIYQIYLRYISKEDIHVYSVDEVFIDATSYLSLYKMTAKELAMKLIKEVLKETGITATAGVATNLFLCKVAMDITAKHMEPDEYGVRIAELDEMSFRRELWDHKPLTDFWRIGPGISRRLEEKGLYTMGDIARQSILDEGYLFKMFGVNAEYIIDHAWGYEPCNISSIKKYRPRSSSMSRGQVLSKPYGYELGRLVLKEMAENLSLELVEKGFVTNQIVVTIGYDVNNEYDGEYSTDRYGRKTPKHSHGTYNLNKYTASTKLIIDAAMKLFDRIANRDLYIRRFYINANDIKREDSVIETTSYEQLNLFTDYSEVEKKMEREKEELNKEKRRQKAVIAIRNKYGKNAILKGMNFLDGATARDRNEQVGGHKK